MSRENVEVVRSLLGPYEGKDFARAIRHAIERVGPDPQPERVMAVWAEDPAWRYQHPDIEWDTTGEGALGTVARGPRRVALLWADWIETWESYVYRVAEYRDLGDWVLTPVDVEARTREGTDMQRRAYQLWQVRDGKVAVQRQFLAEQDALDSVGLRE